MCPSAASLSDGLGAEDISSWPGVRTHDMLQRSMATASLGRLGAVNTSSCCITRTGDSLTRSMATSLLDVLRDADISSC